MRYVLVLSFVVAGCSSTELGTDAGSDSGTDAASDVSAWDAGDAGCACSAATCPDGCCYCNTCLPYASQGHALCGTAGAACAECADTCTKGRCPVALPTGPGATEIAIDDTSIYWTAEMQDAVMKLALVGDAGAVTLVSGAYMPVGIATDGANVYFTNAGDGTVMAVSVDGGPTTTLATGQIPRSVAVSATNVCWTTWSPQNAVMSVPLDGGMPTTIATLQYDPWAVTVDATRVYWTSQGNGTVVSAPLDGGPPTTLASGQANATGIARDANSLYWTTASGVMQVALDGGAPVVAAPSPNGALGVAVDGSFVYWTSYTDGTIMKTPIGGGTPILLARNQPSPTAIVVDATSVYWVAGQRIMRLSPK